MLSIYTVRFSDKQQRAVMGLKIHMIIIFSNNRIFTLVMLKSEEKKLKTSKKLLLSINIVLICQISHFLLTKNLPKNIFA